MVQQKISGQKFFVLRQPRQQIIIYVLAEIVLRYFKNKLLSPASSADTFLRLSRRW